MHVSLGSSFRMTAIILPLGNERSLRKYSVWFMILFFWCATSSNFGIVVTCIVRVDHVIASSTRVYLARVATRSQICVTSPSSSHKQYQHQNQHAESPFHQQCHLHLHHLRLPPNNLPYTNSTPQFLHRQLNRRRLNLESSSHQHDKTSQAKLIPEPLSNDLFNAKKHHTSSLRNPNQQNQSSQFHSLKSSLLYVVMNEKPSHEAFWIAHSRVSEVDSHSVWTDSFLTDGSDLPIWCKNILFKTDWHASCAVWARSWNFSIRCTVLQ